MSVSEGGGYVSPGDGASFAQEAGEPETGEVGPEARSEAIEEATGNEWPEPQSVPVHLTEAVRIEAQPIPAGLITDQVPVPAVGVPVQATRIVPKQTGRLAVVVQPIGGDVYVGNRTVTVTGGFLVRDGSSVRLQTSAEVYAVAPAACTVHTVAELQRALNL